MPKPVPILRGRIHGGRINWYGDDARRFSVIKLALEDQDIEVTLQKKRKPRSDKQLRYYWAVIVEMIAEAAGYTPEEAHEALKWHFLKIPDARLPTVRSTGDMSTAEIEEYYSRCRQLGSEIYGIYIPEPNESEY